MKHSFFAIAIVGALLTNSGLAQQVQTTIETKLVEGAVELITGKVVEGTPLVAPQTGVLAPQTENAVPQNGLTVPQRQIVQPSTHILNGRTVVDSTVVDSEIVGGKLRPHTIDGTVDGTILKPGQQTVTQGKIVRGKVIGQPAQAEYKIAPGQSTRRITGQIVQRTPGQTTQRTLGQTDQRKKAPIYWGLESFEQESLEQSSAYGVTSRKRWVDGEDTPLKLQESQIEIGASTLKSNRRQERTEKAVVGTTGTTIGKTSGRTNTFAQEKRILLEGDKAAPVAVATSKAMGQQAGNTNVTRRANSFLLFLPLLLAPIVFFFFNRYFSRSNKVTEVQDLRTYVESDSIADTTQEVNGQVQRQTQRKTFQRETVDGTTSYSRNSTQGSSGEVATDEAFVELEAADEVVFTRKDCHIATQQSNSDCENLTVYQPGVEGSVETTESSSAVEFVTGSSVAPLAGSTTNEQSITRNTTRGQRQLADTDFSVTDETSPVFETTKNEQTAQTTNARTTGARSTEANGRVSESGRGYAEGATQGEATNEIEARSEKSQDFTNIASLAASRSTGSVQRGSADAADDLTKIKGIGPATATLLNEAGIWSFNDLRLATPMDLEAIITGGGPKFKLIDPATWSAQAELARRGDWTGLATWIQQSQSTTNSNGRATQLEPSVVNAQMGLANVTTHDDLTVIRGIGPATKKLLNEKGINSFQQIARMTGLQLIELLETTDGQFGLNDPQTWPTQAREILEMTETELERNVLDQIEDLSQSAGNAIQETSQTSQTSQSQTSGSQKV